jgi:xanthine dehydrogenase accessory factor
MSAMRELLPSLRRWLERGDDVALGVVVGTRRSAPRPVGSALAVSASGELVGSVSGGCVESEVAEEAHQVLAGGNARLRTYGISDDDALAIGEILAVRAGRTGGSLRGREAPIHAELA